METKFNFKSQICTTREQSERLLALGLKKGTADMMHQIQMRNHLGDEVERHGYYSFGTQVDYAPQGYAHYESIPAWSLHRLMLLATSNRRVMLMRYDFDIFEYLIRRIEYAIEEGYFNKEYLV